MSPSVLPQNPLIQGSSFLHSHLEMEGLGFHSFYFHVSAFYLYFWTRSSLFDARSGVHSVYTLNTIHWTCILNPNQRSFFLSCDRDVGRTGKVASFCCGFLEEQDWLFSLSHPVSSETHPDTGTQQSLRNWNHFKWPILLPRLREFGESKWQRLANLYHLIMC